MPKVTKTTARKDSPKACPQAKAGQVYYWWRTRLKGHRSGMTRCSLSYPKKSQLTRSEYVGAVLGISEDMESATAENVEEFNALRDEWAQQVRDIASEQDDKLSNMPDGLRYSDTGYLLEERRDACQAWADAIEAVEVEHIERDEFPAGWEGNQDYEDALALAIEEALGQLSAECPE